MKRFLLLFLFTAAVCFGQEPAPVSPNRRPCGAG